MMLFYSSKFLYFSNNGVSRCWSRRATTPKYLTPSLLNIALILHVKVLVILEIGLDDVFGKFRFLRILNFVEFLFMVDVAMNLIVVSTSYADRTFDLFVCGASCSLSLLQSYYSLLSLILE